MYPDQQSSGNLGQSVQNAARSLADNLSSAAGQGAAAVSEVSDRVVRIRSAIRQQPITMSVLMLALGYMVGSLLRR
jgi:hypothetical protein